MAAAYSMNQQGSPINSANWPSASDRTQAGENYQALNQTTDSVYSGAGSRISTVGPTTGQTTSYTTVTQYQGYPTVTTTTTESVDHSNGCSPSPHGHSPRAVSQCGQSAAYSSFTPTVKTTTYTSGPQGSEGYHIYSQQEVVAGGSADPSTCYSGAKNCRTPSYSGVAATGQVTSVSAPYQNYSAGNLGTTDSDHPSTYSNTVGDRGVTPYTETFSQSGTTTTHSIFPITSTASLTPHDYAVQNAIYQGRVYSPPGGVYVPGSVALKSGMNTLYDSKIVPTFELPLSFQASIIRTALTRGVTGASHVTNKSNFVAIAHKKRVCC